MNSCELYARSQSRKCEGKERCHWCGSPCSDAERHDEPPPIPFQRSPRSTALFPNSNHICRGCWLWRRKYLTVCFLDGGLKDRQCPLNYSWIIMSGEAKGIHPMSGSAVIYQHLLNPPLLFSLTLLSSGQGPNYIHLTPINDHAKINGDTEITFSLNNKPLSYTVYELESAIRHGPDGRSPGAQALLRLFPPPKELRDDLLKNDPQQRDSRGQRPPSIHKEATDTFARTVAASGVKVKAR